MIHAPVEVVKNINIAVEKKIKRIKISKIKISLRLVIIIYRSRQTNGRI